MDHSGSFKKGHAKVAGRVKGQPNKVTAAIKDMIVGALEEVGGQAYLAEQARKNPVAFMALIAKVLPLQLTGEGGGPIDVNAAVTLPPQLTKEEWLDRHAMGPAARSAK